MSVKPAALFGPISPNTIFKVRETGPSGSLSFVNITSKVYETCEDLADEFRTQIQSTIVTFDCEFILDSDSNGMKLQCTSNSEYFEIITGGTPSNFYAELGFQNNTVYYGSAATSYTVNANSTPENTLITPGVGSDLLTQDHGASQSIDFSGSIYTYSNNNSFGRTVEYSVITTDQYNTLRNIIDSWFNNDSPIYFSNRYVPLVDDDAYERHDELTIDIDNQDSISSTYAALPCNELVNTSLRFKRI